MEIGLDFVMDKRRVLWQISCGLNHPEGVMKIEAKFCMSVPVWLILLQ